MIRPASARHAGLQPTLAPAIIQFQRSSATVHGRGILQRPGLMLELVRPRGCFFCATTSTPVPMTFPDAGWSRSVNLAATFVCRLPRRTGRKQPLAALILPIDLVTHARCTEFFLLRPNVKRTAAELAASWVSGVGVRAQLPDLALMTWRVDLTHMKCSVKYHGKRSQCKAPLIVLQGRILASTHYRNSSRITNTTALSFYPTTNPNPPPGRLHRKFQWEICR